MIYALNDSDERVRAKAADEIGDQIRQNNGCCCTKEVVAALTCALGDCDRSVRRQATEGLEACGYCVVDGCCCKTACCSTGCNSCGGSAAPGLMPTPDSNGGEAAPAPPSDPKAYYPGSPNLRRNSRAVSRRNGLASLLGF